MMIVSAPLTRQNTASYGRIKKRLSRSFSIQQLLETQRNFSQSASQTVLFGAVVFMRHGPKELSNLITKTV